MKKLIIASLIAAASVFSAEAARVTSYHETISYTAETDYGEIAIQFKKCMANNLFTFYNVKINDKVVNSSQYSDNIGPFATSGGWMGGNHMSNSNKQTARTLSYTATVDGKPLTGNNSAEGDVLEIRVENEIFYQDLSGKKFCTEIMTYRVSGNSIEVMAQHEFEIPMTVSLYYGAQSMFPATELLLPGTRYKNWIKLQGISNIDIMKSEKPNFSTFVERCADGYQAVRKYDDGLGNGSCIADNGELYLFRNYGSATGKSYHVMMWNQKVDKGYVTNWHALYTWFDKPISDSFRRYDGQPAKFVYQAYVNSKPVEISLGIDGKLTETAGIDDITVDNEPTFAYAGDGRIVISDSAPLACVYDITGKLIHQGAGSCDCRPGLYVVSNMRGRTQKLLVR